MPLGSSRRSAGPLACSGSAGDSRAYPLVIATGTALGAGLAALLPLPAALLVGLAPWALLAVSRVSLSTLAGAVVVASFFTRAQLEVAAVTVRPEHFLAVLLVAATLAQCPRAVATRRSRAEVALGAFVLWSAATSLWHAPEPASSLRIVAWLALDCATLWTLTGLVRLRRVDPARLARLGVAAAAAHGWVALGLWIGGLVGISGLGVQHEYYTGSVSAFGLAYESNILASQQVVWLGVALTLRLRGGGSAAWVYGGLAAGLLAALTRAAWLGAVVMLLGLGLAQALQPRSRPTGPRRRRAHAWGTAALLTLTVVCLWRFDPTGSVLVEKGVGTLDLGSGSGRDRLLVSRQALNDLGDGDSLLLGRGTNAFGQHHGLFSDPSQPGYLPNLPLAILYDAGLVGVALMAVAMADMVLAAGSGRGRIRRASVLLALLVSATGTSPFWFAFVWLFLFLLVPGVAGAGGDTVNAQRRLGQRPRAARGLAPVRGAITVRPRTPRAALR